MRAEAHVVQRESAGVPVYPPPALRYRALQLVDPAHVRVVILGQDPYHGEGQAMGLAFSVPRGVRTPPSLRNVYKELAFDLGIAPPVHGDLTAWAEQGVLLLNTSLTVEAGQAAAHAKIGWEQVTDALIACASREAGHAAFLLWGNHARAKAPLIDAARHLVLQSAHPSPLSARRVPRLPAFLAGQRVPGFARQGAGPVGPRVNLRGSVRLVLLGWAIAACAAAAEDPPLRVIGRQVMPADAIPADPAVPATHRMRLTLVVMSGTGWRPAAAIEAAAQASAILGQCAIRTTAIELHEVDGPARYRNLHTPVSRELAQPARTAAARGLLRGRHAATPRLRCRGHRPRQQPHAPGNG